MDKEELELEQNCNMYPPRLEVKVQMNDDVTNYASKLKFQGCSEEGSLDTEILLPLGNKNIIITMTCMQYSNKQTKHSIKRST